ncbi:hypothetical protein Tco_0921877 [Tanacetum coccineum]
MLHPSRYFEKPETLTQEMIREWMARQMEANERMKGQTFADDVLLNHVGDKELKSYDDVGIGRMTRKKIEKDENGMSKEPNKDWKPNEKAVPYNKEVYHYLWHPTEIPHLIRIIKES